MTSPTDNRTVLDVQLPEGFEIHRVEEDGAVQFEVHEGGRWTGYAAWVDRLLRPARIVAPGSRVPGDRADRVRAMAVALSLAADEADRLDGEGRGR